MNNKNLRRKANTWYIFGTFLLALWAVGMAPIRNYLITFGTDADFFSIYFPTIIPILIPFAKAIAIERKIK